MPRKSNQTQYDNMMSVFRQHSEQRSSQRRDANPPSQASVPRSRTPHPSQISATTPAGYGYPAQPQVPTSSSGGAVSPEGWGELSYGNTTYPTSGIQSAHYNNPVYGDISAYGPTGAIMPGTSSQTTYTAPAQWIVHFNFDGREQRQIPVQMQRHQVPELQCDRCRTEIRIVHLPSLVNWTPPFGVLWNFRLEGRNGWLEGSNTTACISATKCPGCRAIITLHAPASGGTA